MNIADCHPTVVELDNITFQYQDYPVIHDLNFQILQRDFVALLGSNGAGKTTLLRMIVGLLKPDQGTIRLFGQDISKFKDWERIGYVPQRKSFNPFFPATVEEVVLSGLYGNKKLFRRISKQDMQRCEDALAALGIEDLRNHLIGKLSGGQQQRVFLARALIHNPDLLILDEPTIGIDAETQENFFRMIQHLHQRHNITFLMVTHDLEMMYAYLGTEPVYTSGKLRFYVKHSHDLNACEQTDISHTLQVFNH